MEVGICTIASLFAMPLMLDVGPARALSDHLSPNTQGFLPQEHETGLQRARQKRNSRVQRDSLTRR